MESVPSADLNRNTRHRRQHTRSEPNDQAGGGDAMTQGRRYWLMKSEPQAFSIEDLAQSPKQTTCWDGVRNYQARNFMRTMALGDRVLFYHSSAEPPAVAGIAEVVRAAERDAAQFDKSNHDYGPCSVPSASLWDVLYS